MGFRIQDQGSGCIVQGLGVGVQGVGFGVINDIYHIAYYI